MPARWQGPQLTLRNFRGLMGAPRRDRAEAARSGWSKESGPLAGQLTGQLKLSFEQPCGNARPELAFVGLVELPGLTPPLDSNEFLHAGNI